MEYVLDKFIEDPDSVNIDYICEIQKEYNMLLMQKECEERGKAVTDKEISDVERCAIEVKPIIGNV